MAAAIQRAIWRDQPAVDAGVPAAVPSAALLAGLALVLPDDDVAAELLQKTEWPSFAHVLVICQVGMIDRPETAAQSSLPGVSPSRSTHDP